MKEYSSSPERGSFYRNSLKKQLEQGQSSQEFYDEMIKILDEEDERIKLQESTETIQYSLEHDLRSNENIISKCRNSEVYSQNLYAALCNNRFFYDDKEWTCSWRYAGGIVADILQKGDYIDWYCSGIGSKNVPGYVEESFVTDEIKLDLAKIGWIVKPYGDDEV